MVYMALDVQEKPLSLLTHSLHFIIFYISNGTVSMKQPCEIRVKSTSNKTQQNKVKHKLCV